MARKGFTLSPRAPGNSWTLSDARAYDQLVTDNVVLHSGSATDFQKMFPADIFRDFNIDGRGGAMLVDFSRYAPVIRHLVFL